MGVEEDDENTPEVTVILPVDSIIDVLVEDATLLDDSTDSDPVDLIARVTAVPSVGMAPLKEANSLCTFSPTGVV
jgi:hypothetical protein